MSEPATVHPLVHVVVVDYDGGELTLECLRSLVAADWPADRLHVVLVDNASPHPVTARVAEELPGIEILRTAENLGFAGGANAGLRRRGDADHVAIVNNDATVDPGWLAPLVDTLDDDARVGAACPKILLAGRFAELVVTAPTRRRGLLDRRAVGVRVSGARVGGVDVWARTRLVEGFWGPEPMDPGEAGAQWTTDRAVLRVPVPDDLPAAPVELRLAAEADVDVTVAVGSAGAPAPLRVGREPAWHAVGVGVGVEPVTVVNNVGTVTAADGYAADRGWLEIDRGQYDGPTDVDAWCGAAVLLTKAYLDDVGLFDERLFLYYEDVDLSARGRRRGWRTRTAPGSVVHHVHAATSTEGSALKDHYNERNRLLVLTRTAGVGRAAAAIVRYLLVTLSYARRDVVAHWARGERARPEIVRRRIRALVAYVSAVPAFVSGRGPRR